MIKYIMPMPIIMGTPGPIIAAPPPKNIPTVPIAIKAVKIKPTIEINSTHGLVCLTYQQCL